MEKIAAANLLRKHIVPGLLLGTMKPLVDRVFPLSQAGADVVFEDLSGTEAVLDALRIG